eukprot:11945980-Alexandrium_andersonii.AAC.1
MAPNFLIHSLELEFPPDLPPEAYVEPETTDCVEMEDQPTAPASAPDVPALAGVVGESPAEAEDD